MLQVNGHVAIYISNFIYDTTAEPLLIAQELYSSA